MDLAFSLFTFPIKLCFFFLQYKIILNNMDVWGRTIDHNSSLYKLGLWMASTHSVLSCLVPIWLFFHINGVIEVYHKPGFVVVLISNKPHIKLLAY